MYLCTKIILFAYQLIVVIINNNNIKIKGYIENREITTHFKEVTIE